MAKAAREDDMRDIGQIIADGIAEGIQRNSPKKVPFGRYDPKTPWQPEKAKAHKLTRKCFQNGYRIDPAKLSNEEIDQLNLVTKSGRYIERQVEVIVSKPGGVDEEVEIRYQNKTPDQRFEFKNYVHGTRTRSSFLDMVSKIVDEQNTKKQPEPEPVGVDE